MRTAGDLQRSARRAGMSIVGIERVPSAYGGSTLATRMRFDDPWAAARLLVDLSDEDAADPFVRAWAMRILQASSKLVAAANGNAAGGGPVVAPAAMRAFLASIHASVQSAIRFVREKRETFQSARETMGLGAGDCDDHARLVHALAKSIGGKSKLQFFAKDEQPVHVVARLGAPSDAGDGSGEWKWAETTIPARYGEHPRQAFMRLRASGQLPKVR